MAFDLRLVTAPFRMQPGLRKLEPGASQLTPSQPGDRAMREKLAVLSSFWRQALVGAAGFEPRPALDAVLGQACSEHPEAIKHVGARVEAVLLRWSLHDGEPLGDGDPAIGDCLRALPVAWRLPALLALAFREDLAIIDTVTARVPWMAVCLPSSWAPELKVGQHFASIHAPVADNATLLAAGPHLVRLVAGPKRYERFVWTIGDDPRLHRHPARCEAAAWPDELDETALAQRAFLRTERQTFIPVPAASQAVFTIRVEVEPLIDAITTAADASRLHDALASMSPAVLAYRGLGGARDRLLAWLKSSQAELV